MRKNYQNENRTTHFVKASGRERRKLLKRLKEKGFHISESLSEQEIRTSPYPLAIDLPEKKIFVLAGTVSAAAAAASDVILTAGEFYSLSDPRG